MFFIVVHRKFGSMVNKRNDRIMIKLFEMNVIQNVMSVLALFSGGFEYKVGTCLSYHHRFCTFE